MTFSQYEESVQDSGIVELLQIRLDSTFYAYTNGESTIEYNQVSFIPAPWKRTQPKVDQDQPGSEVEILLPTNDVRTQGFARQWVTSVAESRSTKVTLLKHHTTDPDDEFQIFWIGSIVSIGYEDGGRTTVLLCRSLDNLFTLQGPRKNWGTMCNHQLYDSECTLSENQFTVEATVTAVSANGIVFTVDSLPEPVVRYNSGEFRLSGGAETRMIVARSGNDITVQYPLPGVEAGMVVQIIEGCEHNLTDCAAFPNVAEASGTNIENYGGTPYTPEVNPFEKGLDAI